MNVRTNGAKSPALHPNLRLEIVDVPPESTANFAQDVATALSTSPKTPLPPKYFYDDLGSALFDAITYLPEYYLTRAETEILRDRGAQIVRELGGTVELLDLGSGSAVKTRILIEAALKTQGVLRYHAVDISRSALCASASALADAYHRLLVRGYVGDYFDVLRSRSLHVDPKHKILALCMGSHLGNYYPSDAQQLFALIASALRPGDGLLLGTDLKKDRKTLESAYDDPAGLMAVFGKNLLVRMNRELGATFNLRNFEHVAIYDKRRGSVDSFLQAKCAHAVEIPSANITAEFADGELMHTETSFKFSEDDIARLALRSGFTVADTWYDRSHRFATHLLVREGSAVPVS